MERGCFIGLIVLLERCLLAIGALRTFCVLQSGSHALGSATRELLLEIDATLETIGGGYETLVSICDALSY